MLSTDCSCCGFLKNENNLAGCAAGQLCLMRNGKPVAPGYCRLFTPSDKYQNFLTEDDNIKNVRHKTRLRFDLIINYNSLVSCPDDIKITIECFTNHPCVNNIIILDRSQTKSYDIYDIMKHFNNSNIFCISILDNPSMRDDEAINIVVNNKYCVSPYFMVVGAGDIFCDKDISNQILNEDSRVIFWSMPIKIKNSLTTIVYADTYHGLYIRDAYLRTYKSMTSDGCNYVASLRKKDSFGVCLVGTINGYIITK